MLKSEGGQEITPSDSKSSRRDFLKGRAAADAMAGRAQKAVAADGPAPWPDQPSGDSYLIHVSREAMASRFEVILNAGQYEGGTEAALDALDQVAALEDQMSVFRPASEISHLNRTCALCAVSVEPRLFALLELALRLHAETDGAFDVTSGPLWKVWGFARRAGRVPGDDELAQAMAAVGSHLVELDRERKTVRFLAPGVELNLGSIGKGYALDRCAEVLADAGIHDFLLHAGQSSLLAHGSRMPALTGDRRQGTGDKGRGDECANVEDESAAGDAPLAIDPSTVHRPAAPAPRPASTVHRPPSSSFIPHPKAEAGWDVAIRHPVRRNQRLAELRLHNRGLATSGSGVQYFWHEGRRLGHILDPRTGQPAEGVISATVVAPTAAEADALSTALYVMGADGAIQYCKTKPEIGAVLVGPAAGQPGVRVRLAGITRDELKIVDSSVTIH